MIEEIYFEAFSLSLDTLYLGQTKGFEDFIKNFLLTTQLFIRRN